MSAPAWGVCAATATTFSFLFATAGLAVSIWLGVAALVPQWPFEDGRNIAAGVVLIVLSGLAALVSALIGGLLGAAVGVAGAGCCDAA